MPNRSQAPARPTSSGAPATNNSDPGGVYVGAASRVERTLCASIGCGTGAGTCSKTRAIRGLNALGRVSGGDANSSVAFGNLFDSATIGLPVSTLFGATSANSRSGVTGVITTVCGRTCCGGFTNRNSLAESFASLLPGLSCGANVSDDDSCGGCGCDVSRGLEIVNCGSGGVLDSVTSRKRNSEAFVFGAGAAEEMGAGKAPTASAASLPGSTNRSTDCPGAAGQLPANTATTNATRHRWHRPAWSMLVVRFVMSAIIFKWGET